MAEATAGVLRPLPAAAEALADEVRRAAASLTRIHLRGAGGWWPPPEAPADGTVLSLAHVTHVTGLQPADLVVTAGAGVMLDRLAATLEGRGVWLALDPPGSPSRSVGGALATAAPGPLAARYGAPRDQVLGLAVVTGEGTAVRMGGRVVKNVAGFDLAKAVIGGFGAYGAIVEAHLRLRALPAADRSLGWSGALRDVSAAAARALAAGAAPAALEVLSPSLADSLLGADGWVLLARELGSRTAVDEELLVAEQAAGRGLRRHAAEGAAPWRWWQEAAGRWPVSLRLGADPAAWTDAVALVAEHCGTAAGVSVTVPRGTVRAGFDALAPGAVRALRDAAARRGWPVVLERADPALRDAVGVWGALTPGARRLADALRRAFDPAGAFAAPLFG